MKLTAYHSTVSIVLLAGIIGGVIGGLAARSYAVSRALGLPLFGDISVGGDANGQQFVISQPRNVVVTQNNQVQNAVAAVRRSTVSLYPRQSAYAAAWQPVTGTTTPETYAYAPQERLGEGIVVTNDGWIVTNVAAASVAKSIAIDEQGRRHEITTVATDPLTGLQFARLAEADLPATSFADAAQVRAGEAVVAIAGETVVPTSLHAAAVPLVRSSERLYSGLAVAMPDPVPGAAVATLSGTIVGIIQAEGAVVPMDQVASALPALSADGGFARTLLGIHYVSLADLQSTRPLAGALVTSLSEAPAVAPRSPAATAGVQAGDIIEAINGITVTDDRSVSLLVQEHTPGERITLQLRRAGETVQAEAVLGALGAATER